MGLLTFSINVTLDGCVDHQEGIADDETHAFFTRLMDEGGAMLWGRVTYEMMESYWPAVAAATRRRRRRCASGRSSWRPSRSTWCRRRERTSHGPTATTLPATWYGRAEAQGRDPGRLLLGSCKLATELDRLDLIDEYKFLVHPRIAGHGPTLYQSGLPSTRRLELVSAKPLRSGAVAMHYRRAR